MPDLLISKPEESEYAPNFGRYIDMVPDGAKEGAWLARLGGCPYNTAIAAARLGAKTAFVGRMGSDFMGDMLFERLEANGRTWKVYVCEPMPLSFTGVIHYPRLKDRLATHFVPFAEFEKDAAAGTLPDFSLI